jgi:hypothetical protein
MGSLPIGGRLLRIEQCLRCTGLLVQTSSSIQEPY